MSAGLDLPTRTALERFVQRARRILEEDLSREAEGRFGIHVADGEIEDEDGLHLDPTGLAARRDVVEILTFLRREEGSGREAVARLVREAAFTHLNRLVAIRIAEAIDLLPESLAKGPSSSGFREMLEVAPLLARDTSGGYWRYLQLCGDELAADLPQLFDPRNPLLELRPAPSAVEELVEMFGTLELGHMWGAPDALGWVYQFFNSGDERKAMRDASASPRNSRELAVRNQFFTPRYVVDFLVQNSLGRRLIEADPESGLDKHLPLLIDPPQVKGAPLDLADVRVLDPACGSGHFLLGAYDVLERAWDIAGVSCDEAAPHIVASLWGIDIDARCAQVAAAAVILRARRSCKSRPLPMPNIITARVLPEPTPASEVLLASLLSDRRDLVTSTRDALKRAPVLGSLLKVESILATEIRTLVPGADPDPSTLFGATSVANDAFSRAEAEVLSVLSAIADSTDSGPVDRLFAAEAEDAIRFVEAMRLRYDVVLMNPPYGLATPEAEQYLRIAYSDSWTDLYAAFLERSVDLLRPHGYMAAITSSQYFTTRKMRQLRERMARSRRPVVVIDLGPGVLQGAAVNTALTVVPSDRSTGTTAFLDLTSVPVADKGSTLTAGLRDANQVDVGRFLSLAGVPFAFHVADELDRWVSDSSFEPDVGIVRTGGNTFDNFRFVRCRWEVRTGRDSDGWIPYEKGGDFRPYFASAHLLVDWREDGRSLRELGAERGVLPQVMQSSTLWFGPGLCYPRANKSLGVRVMPSGEIFSEKAIAVFPNVDADLFAVMGFLNSSTCMGLLMAFGRSRFIENSAVKRLPVGRADMEKFSGLGAIAEELVWLFYSDEASDERSAVFEGLPASYSGFVAASSELRKRAIDAQARLDSVVADRIPVPDEGQELASERPELVASVLLGEVEALGEWPLRAFSYSVGLAFGRWDATECGTAGERRSGEAWLQQLPAVAPRMLVNSDGGAFGEAPSGYPLELPRSGVLVDEPGHPQDVEEAVTRAALLFLEESDTSLTELLGLLGSANVRSHLRRKFFKDHLSRYSRSRRKAPIYWPLTISSGLWGVWVYAPALSRETLYAVASAALGREAHAEAEIDRLERERANGATGRSARALDKALDDERRLAEEVRRFREEAERVAGLGWDPDLSDGIVLCAAPLADLFPMWKEPARYREELRDGKYGWATVARWADEL